MKNEFKQLNDSIHLVDNAIIIGQNTPIKDLDSHPQYHRGERIEGYFQTDKLDYKIYNAASIGWPDPSPGPIQLQKKFLQRQKYFGEAEIQKLINSTIQYNRKYMINNFIYEDLNQIPS